MTTSKNSRFLLVFGLPLLFCHLALGADAISPQFNEALDAFNQKDYERSKTLLTALTQQNAADPTYWFNLGNAEFMLEHYQNAISAYEQVITLKSPLEPASRLYISKSYRKLNNLEKAFENFKPFLGTPYAPDLKADVDEEALKLKTGFLEQALNLFTAKNYDRAIAPLQKSVVLGDEPEAQLLLGTSYFYTNKITEAQAALSHALQLKPDQTTRETIEYFLEQIHESLQEGNWSTKNAGWLFLDLSSGRNTNLFDAGNSVSPTFGTLVNVSVGGGYVFFQGKPFFIRLSYLGNWNETIDLASNRGTSQSITSSFTYQKSQFLFQVSPTLQYQTYGQNLDAYLMQPGATIRMEKRWGAPGLGMSYQFLKSGSLNSAYPYLSGNLQTEKLYYNYFGSNTLSTLSLIGMQNQTGDDVLNGGGILPIAYNAYGLGFDWFWFMSSRWSLTFSPTLLYKTFPTNPNPDNGYSRTDYNASAQSKLSFWICPPLRIYLSGSYTYNSSSLGATDIEDMNFSEAVVTGGFTWNIIQ